MKPIAVMMIVPMVLFSCATTNRTKTLLTMGTVGLGTGTLGALAAPSTENPTGHALLWGGIGAALAGAISLFVFDEEARSTELARQNEALKQSLHALNGDMPFGESRLLYETSAPLGKNLPPEYRHLVKPGRWSVYELNQWISPGENVLIHQDRMMKLLPPEFNPNVQKEGP